MISSQSFYSITNHCLHSSYGIFFHPDYTVGFGVTPNHAFRLAGFTAGRKFHPALKTTYLICEHFNTLL